MGVRRWSVGWRPSGLGGRLWNTVREGWYLGFTAFGGPPVHFKILHDKYVTKVAWIDEQIFQELFSVTQAISGPASTKMLYCINLLHDGFLAAVLGFLMWSLPGALGMFGLSIGVSNIGTSLPGPIYSLLSGLNAATVGVIALAAVQLSEKAITDKLTRLLVFLGAAAGMLYNALWYFPVLMAIAGIIAVIYDYRWLHGPVKAVVRLAKLVNWRHPAPAQERNVELGQRVESGARSPGGSPADPPTVVEQPAAKRAGNDGGSAISSARDEPIRSVPEHETEPSGTESEPRVVPPGRQLGISWKVGLLIIALFLLSFVIVLVLRGVLPHASLLYRLFGNMYLAGTIIFGGGPVVIPLLREYVVAEGWVSPRDFLIGLAIIQSFPGPNFNFAVYLGSLTAINGGYPSAGGAVIAFLGIFAPGLVLVHGTMGVWSAVRGLRYVKSAVRGVNAAAVGLIYTAVYRLWQIGYIAEGFQQGTSLANEPWWVVVTATSYVGGYWFGVSAPTAIVMGAVMGMIWYGVVST